MKDTFVPSYPDVVHKFRSHRFPFTCFDKLNTMSLQELQVIVVPAHSSEQQNKRKANDLNLLLILTKLTHHLETKGLDLEIPKLTHLRNALLLYINTTSPTQTDSDPKFI